MKSKPSESGSRHLAENDELAEILETLRMIHRDAVICIEENRFVHLGNLAESCVRQLESMQEKIRDLQSNHVDTRH